MYRLKEIPAVRAIDFVHSSGSTLIKAQWEPVDVLLVRAAIFDVIDGVPHVLLLQRTSTDSLAGHWEFPGGEVETTDRTVMTAVYREIAEETGLTAAWIIQELGSGTRWTTSSGCNYLCVTFVVEVEEVKMREHGLKRSPSGTKIVAASPDDETQSPTHLAVKLADLEHQDYVWVTEDHLKAKMTADGRVLRYTPQMGDVMLQAFDSERKIMGAKNRIQSEVGRAKVGHDCAQDIDTNIDDRP